MKTNTKHLTKPITCQLLKLYKQLQKKSKFNEFDLFDPKSATVSNFDLFESFIEDKAKIYDSLSFLIHHIRNATTDLGGYEGENISLAKTVTNDFFEREGRSLFGVSTQVHFTTFEKINHKMKQIFGIVRTTSTRSNRISINRS